MVEFYLLTFPRLPLRKKKEHKSYFGKNRTHDFRRSRCLCYLLDHSGDESRLERENNIITLYMCGHTYRNSMDQPGKVANPARGQLNRENQYSPVRVHSCLRMWSRETVLAVPFRVSLLISILRLNLELTYGIPPEFRGGAHIFL